MYFANNINELEVKRLNVVDDLMVQGLSITHIASMPIQGDRVFVNSHGHNNLNDSFMDIELQISKLYSMHQQLLDFLHYKEIMFNENEFKDFIESRKVVEKLNEQDNF